jgi:transposase
MWFAGIDWADAHHEVVVIDEAGTRVGQLRVPHSAHGVDHLITWLREIGDIAACPEHLACLIETTQGVLITALLEQGLPVYPVNPKLVEHSRKPSGAKTDAIDAGILARIGRRDLAELRRLHPDPPLIAELKTLTRDQDALIHTQTRLTNQLIACLKAYYPAALAWFDRVAQGITLTFLETFPLPSDFQRVSQAHLTALLKAGHYPVKAEVKAQQLWEQAQAPQLQAHPVVAQAKARYMLALVAQLRLVMQHVAAYDSEIARVFATHADHGVFASLPGAGPRLAPRLLAEWGDDRARFSSAAQLQALAGTSPVLIQSGASRRTRMRNACSKPLRNVMYQFARQSLRHEAWAKRYVERKRQSGKTYSMAMRAVANQWVRILYAVWQKRAVYDPQVFAQAQHAHGAAAG